MSSEASIQTGVGGASRPLTVLQLTPALDAGGVERGTIEIAEAIGNAGGRALVASAGGRLTERLAAVGGAHFILPLKAKNPLAIYQNSRALERLIREEGVDLVHARSRAPAWSGYWAARRTGARFMTTYHGTYSEGFPGKRLYNSVMAKGDPVIAISEFIARIIRERHGAPAERIEVIPRGADVATFSAENVEEARIRALSGPWGLEGETRPVLMLPGRLTRWKGQTLFLDALALLKDRLGEDAFIGVIVGGDAPGAPISRFEQELRDQIARLDLGDVVRLAGHCDDMPAAYRLARYAISASLEPEAFGRVAVEAQAMGAPIIASAHGGAVETVRDGETGWLFAPGSAEALAEALATALAQPEAERLAMSAAAAEHAHRNFSVEAMKNRTLAVYQKAAGRGF